MIDLIEQHNNLSDEDKALLKKLENRFKESQKYRAQFEDKWDEYERFYDGDQWPLGDEKPVDNIIFMTVEGIVPVITDSMPGTDILSRDEGKEESAKQLQAHLNYCYEYNNLHLKLVSGVRKSSISGNPFLYVCYDPQADEGQGMAMIKSLGWRNVYLDKLAGDIDSCSYACIKVPMRIEEIGRMFPKYAGQIKPQSISMDANGKVNGSTENKHSYEPGNDEVNKYDVQDAAFLEEHWIKDYSMEPIPQEETAQEIEAENAELMQGRSPEVSVYEDHEAHISAQTQTLFAFVGQLMGLPPEAVSMDVVNQAAQDPEVGPVINQWMDHLEMHQTYIEQEIPARRPKYPNCWRKIVKTGNLILDKQDDVFVPAGKIPLVPIYCYKDDDKIWGEGDVKNIIDDQKVINEMDYALVANVRLLGNPQKVVDLNSEIDPNSIDNRPGRVYAKKQGTEFRVEQPPPLGGDFRAIREEKKMAAKDKSGMTDAAMGKSPGSNASGKMVRLLQEQAIGRMRLRSRLLESYTMTRLGLICAAYIQKYGVARKIRNTDETGNYVYIDYNPGDVKDLKYEIVTAPGTTAGPDREMIQQELKEALTAGWIDFPMYIKAVNPPYKKMILNALQEKDQQAAMLEQLQMENLKLKAQFAPQTLTPEEIKIMEQMQQGAANV